MKVERFKVFAKKGKKKGKNGGVWHQYWLVTGGGGNNFGKGRGNIISERPLDIDMCVCVDLFRSVREHVMSTFPGAGVFGSLTVWELPVYFFPLDNDLLSMELPGSFRQVPAFLFYNML
jgi:hypothetical protein